MIIIIILKNVSCFRYKIYFFLTISVRVFFFKWSLTIKARIQYQQPFGLVLHRTTRDSVVEETET